MLMRPNLQLQERPALEMNTEAQMQFQTLQELRGVAGQVRDLRTILMGNGEAGETQFGRIPMLEARMSRAEEHVKGLHESNVTARAYWNSARIVGHLLTALGGGMMAEAMHLLLARGH
jgi:hypothetical protein